MIEQLNLFEMANQLDEEKIENSKLTDRQKETLSLIKRNSLVLHKITTQREIYEKVNGYVWNEEESAHDHCTAIWHDINKINFAPENDYIIISKNFEYWIGDHKETKQFIKELWHALLPRLQRHWALCRKHKMDDQFDILIGEFIETCRKGEMKDAEKNN